MSKGTDMGKPKHVGDSPENQAIECGMWAIYSGAVERMNLGTVAVYGHTVIAPISWGKDLKPWGINNSTISHR